ncbi:DUF3768 domain-containing protein [Rhizobium leguminosarum]|uniref:DUF3768 domain-containing protein n=1 Tax=Rhizobium leguminosarum TaxID=384 RepID=UPI001C938460|nr:DUF3768 domain-containing protein [Rhizobium leguminosarum]MBY5820041.1 DUF3768 domain-containing protein [Rhizobium leguminosarum]
MPTQYRKLNDTFRTSLDPSLGDLQLAGSLVDLGASDIKALVTQLVATEQFDSGQHDSGTIRHAGESMRWRIEHFVDRSRDCYADPSTQGYRVLTIFHAHDA